jgi:hypothetical protein
LDGYPPTYSPCRACQNPSRGIYRRLARTDQVGLIWLLHGREVVGVSSDSAAIATPSEVRKAIYPQSIQARHHFILSEARRWPIAPPAEGAPPMADHPGLDDDAIGGEQTAAAECGPASPARGGYLAGRGTVRCSNGRHDSRLSGNKRIGRRV